MIFLCIYRLWIRIRSKKNIPTISAKYLKHCPNTGEKLNFEKWMVFSCIFRRTKNSYSPTISSKYRKVRWVLNQRLFPQIHVLLPENIRPCFKDVFGICRAFLGSKDSLDTIQRRKIPYSSIKLLTLIFPFRNKFFGPQIRIQRLKIREHHDPASILRNLFFYPHFRVVFGTWRILFENKNFWTSASNLASIIHRHTIVQHMSPKTKFSISIWEIFLTLGRKFQTIRIPWSVFPVS